MTATGPPTAAATTRIRGGTVVTASESFVADLYVSGGHVVALGTGLDLPVDIDLDAEGCLVLPG
jgi:dihydropyrimidinase